MLRSIGAVVAGYISMAAIVIIGTAAASAVLVPGGIASMRTGPTGPVPGSFLAMNLLVSLAGAMVGGWLAVRLAPTSELNSAYLLAGVTVLMAIVTAAVNGGAARGEPTWYPVMIGILAVAGVLAGGWLQSRA